PLDFPLLPIYAFPAPARNRPGSGPKPIRATEAGAPEAPIYCGPDYDPSRRQLASNAVLVDQRMGGAGRRARALPRRGIRAAGVVLPRRPRPFSRADDRPGVLRV